MTKRGGGVEETEKQMKIMNKKSKLCCIIQH